MTEQWENNDSLRELTERLRRLDRDIPVPESVKAPQLLARLEQETRQAETPKLRVLPGAWRKAAGMAAAFVVVVGGIWLTQSRGGITGSPMMSAAPASSTAAAVEEAAPQMAAAPEAMEAGVQDAAVDSIYADSYAEVRERLALLQDEEAYYTSPASAAAEKETEAGGRGGPSEMGTGGAAANMGAGDTGLLNRHMTGTTAAGQLSVNLVRTEGDSLYYLMTPVGAREPVVKIVDMNDLSVTATINITQAGVVSDLLVEDGRLAVFYSDENFYTLPVYERQVEKAPVRSGVTTVSATVMEIYDVSDGTRPVTLRKFEQQGDYIAAELISGTISLVTDCAPVTNARNQSARDEELVPAVRDSVVSAEVTPIPAGGICVPENAVYDRYAVISYIDIGDAAAPAKTKAVLGGASLAYRSETALYVAGAFAGEGQTGLLKFTQSGSELLLAAQGSVPGRVESVDALNEKNGLLRAVSVSSGKGSIYVLDAALSQTGTAELPGKPRALCFAGDTLYLTNEQGAVSAVALAGTLGAVSGGDSSGGNTAHLYALADGRAFAVGYDAQKNLEAALYGPDGKKISAVTLGGRGSVYTAPTGETLETEDGLVALPVLLYSAEDKNVFNGFVLLRVSAGGLEEAGRTNATPGLTESEIYAKGLDNRHCVVAGEKAVVLSRAQAVSYKLPELTHDKTITI